MKTLMSVNELAEFLGVARATLYEWCADRQIPFIKVGSRTMFDPDEINRWLDDRRIEDRGPTARAKDYPAQSLNTKQSGRKI